MPGLTDYPRPNVAVDLALLTVEPTPDRTPGRLLTLVLERRDSPAGHVLPGRFIRERETIRETVAAILSNKLDLSPSLGRFTPRLLRVFDEPWRDERGWVMSIGHMVALPWEHVAAAKGEWVPLDANGRLARRRRLLFDHDTILREAVSDMRFRYETEPDPDHLLTGPFTLLELRRLHEAVLGESILKDTFNRRMRKHFDSPTDEAPDLRPVGRPANYFSHAQRIDAPAQEPPWRLPRREG